MSVSFLVGSFFPSLVFSIRREYEALIAILLIFIAMNIYPILFPIYRWHVDCFIQTGSGGKVFAPRLITGDERKDEDYAALAEKRGETRDVEPVREWYRAQYSD